MKNIIKLFVFLFVFVGLLFSGYSMVFALDLYYGNGGYENYGYMSGNYYPYSGYNQGNYYVPQNQIISQRPVTLTDQVTYLEDNEVVLNGRVYLINNPNYYNNKKINTKYSAWFEYGENINSLNKKSPSVSFVLKNNYTNISKTISGLKENTEYFYRLVLKDNNGYLYYGQVGNFLIENFEDSDGEPIAQTLGVRGITDDSVFVRGSIYMNNFKNGLAFFLYGTDEDMIEDAIYDNDTYNDIDEDEDYLMKIRVDRDVDFDKNFSLPLSSLERDTDYYYTMCIQYRDSEGDYRLSCGDVLDFTTDN